MNIGFALLLPERQVSVHVESKRSKHEIRGWNHAENATALCLAVPHDPKKPTTEIQSSTSCTVSSQSAVVPICGNSARHLLIFLGCKTCLHRPQQPPDATSHRIQTTRLSNAPEQTSVLSALGEQMTVRLWKLWKLLSKSWFKKKPADGSPFGFGNLRDVQDFVASIRVLFEGHAGQRKDLNLMSKEWVRSSDSWHAWHDGDQHYKHPFEPQNFLSILAPVLSHIWSD